MAEIETGASCYPVDVSHVWLDGETGFALRTRNDYLSKLLSLELVRRVTRDRVIASAELFDRKRRIAS